MNELHAVTVMMIIRDKDTSGIVHAETYEVMARSNAHARAIAFKIASEENGYDHTRYGYRVAECECDCGGYQ